MNYSHDPERLFSLKVLITLVNKCILRVATDQEKFGDSSLAKNQYSLTVKGKSYKAHRINSLPNVFCNITFVKKVKSFANLVADLFPDSGKPD